MDLSVGMWLLASSGYGGRLRPEIHKIDKVTEHRVVCGRRHIDKSAAMATFATKEDAERLVHRIASINGEHDRRVISARLWADKEVTETVTRAAQVQS